MATFGNYFTKFPFDTVEPLRRFGFHFVLLYSNKSPVPGVKEDYKSYKWKQRDLEGNITDVPIERNSRDIKRHLKADPNNSVGLFPAYAGCAAIDVDLIKEDMPLWMLGTRLLTGWHNPDHIFSWHSSTKRKGHLIFRTDVELLNAKRGRVHHITQERAVRIVTRIDRKLWAGDFVHRHYIRVHRPRKLVDLLKWIESKPKKLNCLDQVDEDKSVDYAPDDGEHPDVDPDPFLKGITHHFKTPFSMAKSRHDWINIEAASMGAKGYSLSETEKRLSPECGKYPNWKKHAKEGWTFGSRGRSVRKGRNASYGKTSEVLFG